MNGVAVRPDHPLQRPWSGAANPLGLTELDVATGMVLGMIAADEWGASEQDPLSALEGVARDLLSRGRCVVAFSGGRDSSALLAVLLRVARRDGFEEPVAVTARWPGDAASDERDWQEHVAAQLKVRHWEILTPGTDVDLLGPLSCRLLRAHGLLWPAPFAALLPMVDAAGDGVLVTGHGGDELFAHWPLARAWGSLRRGRALRPSARALAFAALPVQARRRRAFGRVDVYQRWLRPEVRRLQRQTLAGEVGGPLFWSDHLREVAAQRSVWASGRTLSILCATRGGSFARPLLAPPFLAALARRGGFGGLGDRTQAMVTVFGSVLGPEILSRSTKATFGDVFWGPATRAFARSWDGQGLDPRWVDAEALRGAWEAATPVYGAALPLQAAWLALNRSR